MTVLTRVVVDVQEVRVRQSNRLSPMPAHAILAFIVLQKFCPDIVIRLFSKSLPKKPVDVPVWD